MANGGQCCALEICCNFAQRRERLPKKIAEFIGAEEKYCARFLEWMDHEGLTFAPESFRAVIDEISMIAKKHAVNGKADDLHG